MSHANITLWIRDIASDLESVPSTFSSWDRCMAKSYCKRRDKTPRHFDDPPFHQPPPPAPNPVYQAPPAPPAYSGAQQTAHFDAPKFPDSHINEDALPEMPTWAGAVDKRVECPNNHGDVELEPLNPPDLRRSAGTSGAAYSDYSPNLAIGAAVVGYGGSGPTDPRARRSPGPVAALDYIQDPYGHHSAGMPSSGAVFDPYGSRSPGSVALATQDPYGRRSPGPAAAWTVSQDPYGRRSPGISALAPNYGAAAHDPYGSRSPDTPIHAPYDQQLNQASYDDHSYGAGNGYHVVTAPSPVTAYKPHTNYSPVPMAFSSSSERDHSTAAAPAPGFQRQPSFGSSQHPPTHTSQPLYRAFSPGAPSSSPHAFSVSSPSGYTTYNPHANATPMPYPENTRPPSLLQSGKRPTVNTSSNL
ncbi:hypothetical protein PDIG_82390 [Penicillium digitatum PHI26]|uniref:Uncharacterized protein n=2 Tax=Penicillium digitatum TaxID=36651 RepID=K9FC59_PEND2|nr:hypothetical protein PDIP_88770 [Penicillium digitatum Pd1]EKV04096.1 hypothetical protein PDIP_88770 [Penicillium digitatum Pd1]EKV05697.1 hypothetical protein PDIG_82390 [Penicillium digitatum PHI26]KAG0160360.1 hypothetical protein PDIDSM_7887 [Penicillium digitatum]